MERHERKGEGIQPHVGIVRLLAESRRGAELMSIEVYMELDDVGRVSHEKAGEEEKVDMDVLEVESRESERDIAVEV